MSELSQRLLAASVEGSDAFQPGYINELANEAASELDRLEQRVAELEEIIREHTAEHDVSGDDSVRLMDGETGCSHQAGIAAAIHGCDTPIEEWRRQQDGK